MVCCVEFRCENNKVIILVRLIKNRLDSGRAKYIKEGGKLGRKVGSTKDSKQL